LLLTRTEVGSSCCGAFRIVWDSFDAYACDESGVDAFCDADKPFGISSMVLCSRQTKALPQQKMSANIRVGQTLYASFLGFLGGLVAG